MNLNYNILCLFLILLVKSAKSAKVLFICTLPAKSHQKIYSQVWMEMSLRGHDVHVVTPLPLNNSTLTNLTEYDISDMPSIKNLAKKAKNAVYKNDFLSLVNIQIRVKEWLLYDMNKTANSPTIKKLIETHKAFDVCIVEWMFPTLAIYSHIFKCPLIGISSTGARVFMLDAIGSPSHPILAPDPDLPLSKDVRGFYERLWSAVWTVFLRFHYNFILLPDIDKLSKTLYGPDTPYFGDLQNNVSLLLLNQNRAFHRPIPTLPNIIDIGGFKQQPIYGKEMPKELKYVLDNASNGIIYFSFGTGMLGHFLHEDKIKIIQNVFKSLPFTFLWKWESSSMIGKPENVYISKWFPQTDVLEHPNVKLFITQGGLQSIEEAIVAHKPIIGIPSRADQTTNTDTCVKYGMGKLLNLNDLTEEKLRSYILEIVNDPTYAQNAKNLDEIIKDQPQDGLDKAIWWIEYVIRHKGAKHFRSPAIDLPWWEYFLLNVIGFVVGSLILILFTLKYLIKRVFGAIFKQQNSQEKKKKVQ